MLLQEADPKVHKMILYLQNVLPSFENRAQSVALQRPHFDLIDGILHYENPNAPGKWCLVVPQVLRLSLLKAVHAGKFAGHFAERCVYDRLGCGY